MHKHYLINFINMGEHRQGDEQSSGPGIRGWHRANCLLWQTMMTPAPPRYKTREAIWGVHRGGRGGGAQRGGAGGGMGGCAPLLLQMRTPTITHSYVSFSSLRMRFIVAAEKQRVNQSAD